MTRARIAQMLPTDADGRFATGLKVVLLALALSLTAAAVSLPSLWVSKHISPAVGVPLGMLCAVALGAVSIVVLRRHTRSVESPNGQRT